MSGALERAQEELLAEFYKSPDGLVGKQAFWLKVKARFPDDGFTRQQVLDWVAKQPLHQVNAPPPFKGFFRIIAPPRTFQVDVLELPAYVGAANGGITKFLIAVDVLSRYMVMVPMKRKGALSMVAALDALVKQVGVVNAIEGDNAFSAEGVVAWCNKHHIMRSTDVAREDHLSAGDRLGIVDGACRTIKKRIRNHMTAHSTAAVVDALPELVRGYNDTIHSALKGHTPAQAWKDEMLQGKIFSEGVDYNTALKQKVELAPGTHVRHRLEKGVFDKEQANFSSDIHIVHKVVGNKYLIKDAAGKVQKRRFKYFELLKVHPQEAGSSSGAAETELAAGKKAATAKRRLAKEGLDGGDAAGGTDKRVTRSQAPTPVAARAGPRLPLRLLGAK